MAVECRGSAGSSRRKPAQRAGTRSGKELSIATASRAAHALAQRALHSLLLMRACKSSRPSDAALGHHGCRTDPSILAIYAGGT